MNSQGASAAKCPRCAAGILAEVFLDVREMPVTWLKRALFRQSVSTGLKLSLWRAGAICGLVVEKKAARPV